MSGLPDTIGRPAVPASVTPARDRGRRAVAALSIAETISWGILYYAFAVVLRPIADTLGASTTVVSGALTLAVLVSAVVGVAVGRHLDRHAPRLLMTVGALAGVALMVAWSRVESVLALYVVFAGIGAVMATVLYEPAFVVLAKLFPDTGPRRRAMTTLTLVAALASFIFVPLAQALLDRHGWRETLLILAAVLAITIPLHALLPTRSTTSSRRARARPSEHAREIVGRGDFRRLTAGYFLATIAGLALLVELLPMLEERGYTSAFAAFVVGTLGIAQIPGRLLFALAGRWLGDGRATPVTFALIAAGLLILLVAPSALIVLVGVLVLGMGNGMAILSRATTLAERFGTADYGTVASITAATTTVARAAGPLLATGLTAVVGVEVLTVGLIGCALAAVIVTASLGAAAEARS